MADTRERLSAPAKQPGCRPAQAASPEPFLYSVAANLYRVLHLSREEQLSIWKRVRDLYSQTHKDPPGFLEDLCRPRFVEALMENELFWGMVGVEVNRMVYASATDYLPAVYAAAALMAAKQYDLALRA